MSSMIVSEQARRATLSMLPLGAFETAPDGAWDFVTPGLVELFGDIPTSSLLGREWLSLVHRDDFQRVVAEYRQAREYNRPWVQAFRMLRPDGIVIHVGVDANPLPQEPGQRGRRYVGLVKDRTIVVRALEQAREFDELRQELQELVREGIIINRVDITVAANSAAARILKFDSADELIGMSGSQRVHPDDLEEMMRYARSDSQSRATVRFKCKDGSYRMLLVHGRSIMYAGAPARLVSFLPVDDPLIVSAEAG